MYFGDLASSSGGLSKLPAVWLLSLVLSDDVDFRSLTFPSLWGPKFIRIK